MTQNDVEPTKVEVADVDCLPDLTECWQTTIGWQPDADQQVQFQQLYQFILAGNQRLNLTRITAPTDFWEKHLWDSLRGIQHYLVASAHAPVSDPVVPAALKVIDIGTGAGFPGIPIAIAQPSWTVVLLDSTQKKIQFIQQGLVDLGLKQIVTLAGRAETIGQQPQHRQTYDLALIRAVAAATVCAEYSLPLLKLGGQAVLYRGQWTPAEQTALEIAVNQLGGTIDRIEGFKTPLTQSERHCIYLKKVAATPREFPRPVGVPTQNPIEAT